MKNFLKKAAIIAIAVALMNVTANAQTKGDKAIGAHIALATGNHYSHLGIGGKFQYNILDAVRAEGSLTFYPPKDYVSMWDVSLNGHYLIPVADKITVYPLAGVGLLGARFSWEGHHSSSNSVFCLNLGGGADYELMPNIALNAELKYKIAEDGWGRLMPSVGIAYKF